MSTLDEEERREYYRIDDMIALQIKPLSGPDAASKEVLLDDSPLFNLLSELHLANSKPSTCCARSARKTAAWRPSSKCRTNAWICSARSWLAVC